MSQGKPLCTHAQWHFVLIQSLHRHDRGYQWISVYSVVVDVERHDKALCCAVPHPQKAVGSFVIPFPPPSPPSQQCAIDSSLRLVAKASKSWIMKCSCGKKNKI